MILSASATIANPGELTSRLIGRDVQVIDNDGSPRGKKYFVLWNPSPVGKDQLARRSATDDAVWLMAAAMTADAQALTFTRTRQATELVNRYTQDLLREQHSPLAETMRAYRGGYLPNERREIERDLFSGKLRGVAATNALELGVDIGSLDVAPQYVDPLRSLSGRIGLQRERVSLYHRAVATVSSARVRMPM